MTLLEAIDVSKHYAAESGPIPVLSKVSLAVEQGEFLAVVGRSGSGKSTLLNILSTLLRPDSGEVRFAGRDLAKLPEKELARVRRSDFAVVFQMHHLLPYFTALENVLLPFMGGLAPVSGADRAFALECLERVGLVGKQDRLPGKLSGGEQQRVAIARALVKRAQVLFADEPTGSLDPATGKEIVSLLKDLNRDGLTVLMVTHDAGYAKEAGRVVEMGPNGARR